MLTRTVILWSLVAITVELALGIILLGAIARYLEDLLKLYPERKAG